MNDDKLKALIDGPQADRDEAINDAAHHIGNISAALRLVDVALQTGYDGCLYSKLDITDDASSAVRILADALDQHLSVIVELT